MTQGESVPIDLDRTWRRLTRFAILDVCIWIVTVAFSVTLADPDPAAKDIGKFVGYALPVAVLLLLVVHLLWIATMVRMHRSFVQRGATKLATPVILVLSLAFVWVAPLLVVPYMFWAAKQGVAVISGYDSMTGVPIQTSVPRPSIAKPLVIAAVITAVVAGGAGYAGATLVDQAAETYTARDAATAAVDGLSSDLTTVGDSVPSDDADATARLEEARTHLEDAKNLIDEATFFSAEEYGEAESLAKEGSEIIVELTAFVADRDGAEASIGSAKTAMDAAKSAVEPNSAEADEYAAATEAYEAAVAAFGDGLYADRDGFAEALTQATTAFSNANAITTRVTALFTEAETAGSDWASYVAYLKFYTKYPHTAEAKKALTAARDVASQAVKSDYDNMLDVLKHNTAWAKDPMDFQRDGWVELPEMVEDAVLDQYKECKNSIKSTKATKDLCTLNKALYEAAWAGNQFKKVIKRLEDESTVEGNMIVYYYDDAMTRQMNELNSKMKTNLNTAKDALKKM